MVSLNIIIQMEYTDGQTLRDFIDTAPVQFERKDIFSLFSQLMVALK